MKLAVVGHVEWVEFARVESVPRRGEIVNTTETWEEPAGGGAVAAVRLAQLGCGARFFTALGGDELGRRARERLAAHGVIVHATTVSEPQRRAFVFVDGAGERTITVLGEKLRPQGTDGDLPWEELAECDGVYFACGDVQSLRVARKARVLVATARELPTLQAAGVAVDVLVASGKDEGERYQAGDLDPPPELVVTTAGALGGWMQPGGPFSAATLPGPVEDAYGCGDSFAAGLTFSFARGESPEDAVAFAATCGAEALTRRGAHGVAA